MRPFMNDHFLLTNVTAVKLYEKAASLPIIDYHCHIDPKEIAENKKHENLTQLWLNGDHYKWRLMRANGVEERYITGDAEDFEKFLKYAETMEKAIGNPVYTWSHMELKRYFQCDRALNRTSAKEIWDHCIRVIEERQMTVRTFVEMSNVRLICTTDDPADTLEYHEQIKRDKSFSAKVLPAWRPDRAVSIEKPSFPEYVNLLSGIAKVNIHSLDSLKRALTIRMDYFEEHGCCLSDHGLYQVMCAPVPEEQLELIFQKGLRADTLTEAEILGYKTGLMLFLAREYARRNWVMQIHYGAKRNNNSRMFHKLGADTGYDAMAGSGELASVADFLDSLESTSELPKTVLYSLNPADNEILQTIAGCFPGEGIKGKVHHGAAWWFNDHKAGIEAQMESFANQGLLGNFIGMLTDSRSFSSYVRHDYFRRIFCDKLGRYVEDGQYPADWEQLESIVKGVCYKNCLEFFGFDINI